MRCDVFTILANIRKGFLALSLCATSAFSPAAAALRCMPSPALAPRLARTSSPLLNEGGGPFSGLFGNKGTAATPAKEEAEEDKITLEKIASYGIAGVLSIAVAETVFWVLSFPTSALFYYFATGEWIDLTVQEGQVKFLAYTAGWGALGGAIAQYRTVLTAAAMTPWMDANVVKPYIEPLLNKEKS